jgi:hypothetical protein
MRVMYKTVFGEGMGELDAATRRTLGFGDAPDGGVLCHDSFAGFGERAKLGMRKASFGLERGTCCAEVCGELSLMVLLGVFGVSEAFAAPPMPIPSKT